MSRSRWKLYVHLLISTLLGMGATSLIADEALLTIMRWSGNGAGPDERTATYIPWLTPVALLKMPYSSWPATERQKVSQAEYDHFWQVVQARIDSGYSQCSEPPKSNYAERTISEADEPVTAIDAGQNFPLVLVGTLLKDEPAWDYRLDRLASITYIKVNEVIKNGQNRRIPKVVKIDRSWGVAVVPGTTLCSKGDESRGEPSFQRMVSGPQQVVVVGRLASGNTDFIETAPELVFRLDSNELHYPANVAAYPATPLSLTTFRAQVQN